MKRHVSLEAVTHTHTHTQVVLANQSAKGLLMYLKKKPRVELL